MLCHVSNVEEEVVVIRNGWTPRKGRKNIEIYIYTDIWFGLGKLQMVVQDVAFLPSRASFSTTFPKIVVEVEALGPPHVLKLWLWVSKGMLPIKYFWSTKTLF